jgi:hypothetical protein
LQSRIVTKIWRGSNLRPSRFHDEKGNLALHSAEDYGDAAFGFLTTVLRVSLGYRFELPFIALNAFRFLKSQLHPEWRVFEWSSGMSTLWFERHCAEVYAVEDDPVWFQVVSSRTQRAQVFHLRNQEYVNKIRDFPRGYFDLISIDGSERLACFDIAEDYLRPGGFLLIDNTDKDRTTNGDLFQIDRRLAKRTDFHIHRFTGWAPGNFFPQETTICVPQPYSGQA